ncbi:hypothetical protein SPONN_2798 [uncultured Candidatus Thioglobus sp.]|nr:hypothetical protein SPONN_2798 [uncultured Candidatus Thioglobus sp.]SMM99488.1 hypothetical protein SPONL_622 [uncultured Candidatus Thioglobus sp.]
MNTALNDKTIRLEIKQDPIAFAKKLGYTVNSDTKIVIMINTKEITYIAFDESNDALLEGLDNLNAAGYRTSTASTLLSCLSSIKT